VTNQLGGGRHYRPMMAAVVHTVITCGIDPECFDGFFNAMAMDLTTTLSFPVDEGTLSGGQARPDSSALGEEPPSGATRAPDQAPYPAQRQ